MWSIQSIKIIYLNEKEEKKYERFWIYISD